MGTFLMNVALFHSSSNITCTSSPEENAAPCVMSRKKIIVFVSASTLRIISSVSAPFSSTLKRSVCKPLAAAASRRNFTSALEGPPASPCARAWGKHHLAKSRPASSPWNNTVSSCTRIVQPVAHVRRRIASGKPAAATAFLSSTSSFMASLHFASPNDDAVISTSLNMFFLSTSGSIATRSNAEMRFSSWWQMTMSVAFVAYGRTSFLLNSYSWVSTFTLRTLSDTLRTSAS
mmetsp:Transcript_121252/g.343126  ORF Transcript_121252/g.343126 Transcript_121252/m.343126 type:complete len:233 (+) Transcript_121252:377-1075(+)